MRDTTLTSPEMHMERVAACFYMKYHVYWENITDQRSFIYFILLLFILFYFILFYYFIIIIIIIILLLLLLLLLLLFYFIDHLFSWVSSMFTIWTAR